MPLYYDHARTDRVRLQTLVGLRWIAIIGQIITLTVAVRILHLDLPLGLASVLIGASVVVNLLSTFLSSRTARLDERRALQSILFDVVQLGGLVMLTGGLSNPFALLILAPVTIGATFLRLRGALIVVAVAIVIVLVMPILDWPLMGPDGPLDLPPLIATGMWCALLIGLIFIGLYQRSVSSEIFAMEVALEATRSALAREQKLTDLGGVIAATAHELGTPLATIKLVSGELAHEVRDDPELSADVQLIREQTERCRDILHSMGKAGKEDLMVRNAPLSAIVQEAAGPHKERGATVRQIESGDPRNEPMIRRQPEVIHGLRNLIQNAVDFARQDVLIMVDWTEDQILVTVSDDGPGFPSWMFGRIGEPYPRRVPRHESGRRSGYDGMGLGLFIAKTLLERSGARISFANNPGKQRGAVIELSWDRDQLEDDPRADRHVQGKNPPIR